jgi:hypothetical protein
MLFKKLTNIMRLIDFRNMTSFGMAIALLTTTLIMCMIGLLDMGDVGAMIRHMTTMNMDLAFPIKTGKIAVRGIMVMEGIVMIQIMIEVVGETVVGVVVNLVIAIVTR